MIKTPLGNIIITADDVPYLYEEKEHKTIYDNVEGCFRITILAYNFHSVKCMLDTNLRADFSSGEEYQSAEFECGSVFVSIGGFDDHKEFETLPICNGLEYRINSPVKELIFGIAWVTDYKDHDVRTWLAADPS